MQLGILNSQILMNSISPAEVAHLPLVEDELHPTPLFEDHTETSDEAGCFRDYACPTLRIGPHFVSATWPTTRIKSQKTNWEGDRRAKEIEGWNDKELLEHQDTLNNSTLKK